MEESGHNSGSSCRCISDHEIRGTCDAPISFRLASGTRHTSGSSSGIIYHSVKKLFGCAYNLSVGEYIFERLTYAFNALLYRLYFLLAVSEPNEKTFFTKRS